MVGEFLILIAIVILGGALIKILADMRSNADRQIKVAEEILEAVVSIRSNVHGMAHPAKFVKLETDINFIRDHTDGLMSCVDAVEAAVDRSRDELKNELAIRLPFPPVDLGPQPG